MKVPHWISEYEFEQAAVMRDLLWVRNRGAEKLPVGCPELTTLSVLGRERTPNGSTRHGVYRLLENAVAALLTEQDQQAARVWLGLGDSRGPRDRRVAAGQLFDQGISRFRARDGQERRLLERLTAGVIAEIPTEDVPFVEPTPADWTVTTSYISKVSAPDGVDKVEMLRRSLDKLARDTSVPFDRIIDEVLEAMSRPRETGADDGTQQDADFVLGAAILLGSAVRRRADGPGPPRAD